MIINKYIGNNFKLFEFNNFGKVIFGHQPFMQESPKLFPHAIGIDTGCIFGGFLTALIVTEKNNFISVIANQTYLQVKD